MNDNLIIDYDGYKNGLAFCHSFGVYTAKLPGTGTDNLDWIKGYCHALVYCNCNGQYKSIQHALIGMGIDDKYLLEILLQAAEKVALYRQLPPALTLPIRSKL